MKSPVELEQFLSTVRAELRGHRVAGPLGLGFDELARICGTPERLAGV